MTSFNCTCDREAVCTKAQAWDSCLAFYLLFRFWNCWLRLEKVKYLQSVVHFFGLSQADFLMFDIDVDHFFFLITCKKYLVRCQDMIANPVQMCNEAEHFTDIWTFLHSASDWNQNIHGTFAVSVCSLVLRHGRFLVSHILVHISVKWVLIRVNWFKE